MTEVILKFTVDEAKHKNPATGVYKFTEGSICDIKILFGDGNWSDDVGYFYIVHMLDEARKKILAEIDADLAAEVVE